MAHGPMHSVSPEAPWTIECAGHFGVPPENYVASLPNTGRQLIEVVRQGLKVVTEFNGKGERYKFPNNRLFEGVYSGTVQAEPYVVSEELDEYCRDRNIPPYALALVGQKLLIFAMQTGVGIGDSLLVRKNNSLDSTLRFRATPLNTIATERSRATLRQRFGFKYGF